MKRLFLTLTALLSLSISAFAADVTGKWTAEIPGGRGPQTTTFNFKVDGSKLSGSVATQRGDAPITEGKVDGDNISFTQTLSFNGNDITMTYKGVVKGDTIELTRDGGRGPVTFTAKKSN
jgi:hypothetical protein